MATDVEWAFRILEILAIVGGLFIWLVKSGKHLSRYESLAETQTNEIADLKRDVKGLSQLIIELTKLGGRIDLLEERQMLHGKRLDETVSRLNRFLDDLIDRWNNKAGSL